MSAVSSAETLQARREWQDIFKVLKGKNLPPRLLYPARLLFRFDREIKNVQTAKAKRIQHHETSFTSNSEGILYAGNIREQKMKGIKKTYKNIARTIKKMAIETHILIMTLNVNRLNAPTKRHRLAECI